MVVNGLFVGSALWRTRVSQKNQIQKIFCVILPQLVFVFFVCVFFVILLVYLRVQESSSQVKTGRLSNFHEGGD